MIANMKSNSDVAVAKNVLERMEGQGNQAKAKEIVKVIGKRIRGRCRKRAAKK